MHLHVVKYQLMDHSRVKLMVIMVEDKRFCIEKRNIDYTLISVITGVNLLVWLGLCKSCGEDMQTKYETYAVPHNRTSCRK